MSQSFTTVSIADFRANMQNYIKEKLPLLLARHSDVVAVVLAPSVYNELIKRIGDLEETVKNLKKED